MSTPTFLPALGSGGIWTLNAPYSNLVLATTYYDCISIQLLSGAVAQGQDPLNTVYLANGDTEANFNTDLANDDYLITITSGDSDIVTFPRSAMTSLPDSDGVLYRNVMMGVSLSLVPDSMNLDSLAQDVQALVTAQLGVTSSVYFATIGAATILSADQATALAAARAAQISDQTSLQYRNEQLQAQNALLTQKLAILSSYIATHYSP